MAFPAGVTSTSTPGSADSSSVASGDSSPPIKNDPGSMRTSGMPSELTRVLGREREGSSDAGGVLQRLLRLPTGGYDWIPPQIGLNAMRAHLKPDLSDAPAGGGAIMMFYVRDGQ